MSLDYVRVLIPIVAQQIVDQFGHIADTNVAITVHIPLDTNRKKGHSTRNAQITFIDGKDQSENAFQ